MRIRHLLLLALFLLSGLFNAQAEQAADKPGVAEKPAKEKQSKKKPPKPTAADRKLAPTVADFVYGEDSARQVFDFWQAKSDTPTPLLVLIHGGGWQAGDKTMYSDKVIQEYLDAGISVAAINYRFINQAMEQGVKPPVKAPLQDAARAIQTLRSKAKEWNLDPTRVAATGGSAGACTSLWLALHDDLADPKSSDPIARESTRLTCAAVVGAQTSLDPKQRREWMPNAWYGGRAFGYPAKDKDTSVEIEQPLANREKILPWIKEYSPIELVTKDDPAIYLDYPNQRAAPTVGESGPDPTHSAVYGLKLQEALKGAGVEAVLAYPADPDKKYGSVEKFIIAKLKAN